MKIVFIDESGVINDKDNRYFIIAGLVFDDKHKNEFEQKLYPFVNHILTSYHLGELKK